MIHETTHNPIKNTDWLKSSRSVPTKVDSSSLQTGYTVYLEPEAPITIRGTQERIAGLKSIYSYGIRYDDSYSLSDFLELFDVSERDTVRDKLETIRDFPFVADIKYLKADIPTVNVKLSIRTRENEDEVYGIEYDILSEIESIIDLNIVRD